MVRRAVFVDVDGTLVNDRGVIPDSARAAIRQARANGHLVFLCTGRSITQIWAEILDVGFDGIVAAAGGYVEVGGAVLAHVTIPVDQMLRVTTFFDAHGVDYLLESNDGLFGSSGVQARMRRRFLSMATDEDVLAELERGMGGFLERVVVGADPATLRINKVTFLGSGPSLDEIRAELGDAFDVIPSSVAVFGTTSGELSQRGVHKATGIEVVIEHLGIPRADTIAIGDGYNDLEMLAHVGVGIAMGNAPQEVLAVADAVTGTPDEDGLRDALRAHGLI